MTKSSDEYDDDNYVSKSQLKRDAHALTDLGSKLLTLSIDQLQKFDLPNNLLEAIKVAKNIKKHGALKRQKLYIGKLLRSIDAKPIETQFEMLQSPHREDVKHFHDVEKWRDTIIDEPKAVNEFLAKYPMAQRQTLLKLQKDTTNSNSQISTRAKRKLFVYIKEFVFEQIEQENQSSDQDDFL